MKEENLKHLFVSKNNWYRQSQASTRTFFWVFGFVTVECLPFFLGGHLSFGFVTQVPNSSHWGKVLRISQPALWSGIVPHVGHLPIVYSQAVVKLWNPLTLPSSWSI